MDQESVRENLASDVFREMKNQETQLDVLFSGPLSRCQAGLDRKISGALSSTQASCMGGGP